MSPPPYDATAAYSQRIFSVLPAHSHVRVFGRRLRAKRLTLTRLPDSRLPGSLLRESFPRCLPGDAESITNRAPAHVSLSQRVDLRLQDSARRLHRCHSGLKRIEQLLVTHCVPAGKRRGRRI